MKQKILLSLVMCTICLSIFAQSQPAQTIRDNNGNTYEYFGTFSVVTLDPVLGIFMPDPFPAHVYYKQLNSITILKVVYQGFLYTLRKSDFSSYQYKFSNPISTYYLNL